MSKNIERNIVDMQFNNEQFEKGVQETTKTLDKFKQALELKGADEGIKGIEKASKGMNLAYISNGLDTISIKFSALGVLGFNVFNRLADSAVNMSKRLASAFTTTPIKTGFSEYETQMNAVQTILANTASKGSTLKDVNAALNELNKYADMTIYNFTEMTRNIGTFTAAGVELDTSVSAIKGIANLAAVSGSTSQQASTAMYQLSQALSSGTVKLQDWNSVVNAGMGGQVFQDALKETARVHKINIDDMIKDEGSFRETLSKGWLTSAILTETLSKFTGDLTEAQIINMGYTKEQAEEILKLGVMANDAATKVKTFSQLWETLNEAAQSGWTQTWEILVGDFEEAKAFLTGLSDLFGKVIDDSSKARNDLLKGWKDLGGRTDVIDGLYFAIHSILDVVSKLSEGFRQAFPKTTSQQLYNLTNGFKVLMENISKFTTKHGPVLIDIGRAVGSVISVVTTLIKGFVGAIAQIISIMVPASSGIMGFVSSVSNFITHISEMILKSEIIPRVFKKIVDALTPAAIAFRTIVTFIGDVVVSILNMLTAVKKMDTEVDESMQSVEKSFNIFKTIGNVIDAVKQVIYKFTESIGPWFGTAVTVVRNAMKNIWKAIKETFTGADLTDSLNILNVALIGSILLAIRKFVKGFGEQVEKLMGDVNVFGKVKDVLDGVKDSLSAWQSNLNAKTIMTLAISVAILAASIVTLSMIDPVKLTGALSAVGVMMGGLIASITVLSKLLSSSKMGQVGKATTAMILFSAAILIMSHALKRVSEIPSTSLVKGMLGIATLSTMMVIIARQLSKSDKKIQKGMTSMILFAVALDMMTRTVKKLSEIPYMSLIKGLGAFGVMLGTIGIFMKFVKTDLKVKDMLGLILLSTAIKVLVGAIKGLSEIPFTSLVKGLGALTAILTVLTAFTVVVGKNKSSGIVATSVAMVVLSVALKGFTSVIERLSVIPYTSLGKGLLAFAGILGAVVIAMKLLPKNILAQSIAVGVLALAMGSFAKAVEKMSKIPFTSLTKALIAFGAIMTMVVISLRALGPDSIGGAAAILLLATAINMLVVPITLLGTLPILTLVKGIATLAAIFAVLGVSAAVLAPLSPVLIILAGAIALMGVAMLAAGAGIAAFAIGMASLSGMTAAGVLAITTSLRAVISLIPAFLKSVGLGLVDLVVIIGAAGSEILTAVSTILSALLLALIENVPLFVELVAVTLTRIAQALTEFIPVLIELGMTLFMSLLNTISDNIYQIVDVAGNIITQFLLGIANRLGDIIDAAFKLIISFINGLAEAIKNNHQQLRSAVWSLITAILESMLSFGGELLSAGTKAIGSILSGLKQAVINIGVSLANIGKDIVRRVLESIFGKKKDSENAGSGVISNILTGLWNGVKNIGASLLNVGKNIVSGIASGIANAAGGLISGAVGVVSGAVNGVKKFLGIKSPSRLFMGIGGQTMEGLSIGFTNMKDHLKNAAVKTVDFTVKALEKSMDVVSDLVSTDFSNSPVITPVLNLDEYDKSLAGMNDMESKLGRLDAEYTGKLAGRVSIDKLDREHGLHEDKDDRKGGETNITVNQTNTSPKALSRLDILRDTKAAANTIGRMVKEVN